MSKTIEAIYENGVFKPLEKIELNEHQKIEIIIKEIKNVAKANSIVKGSPKVIEEVALNPEYSCLEE